MNELLRVAVRIVVYPLLVCFACSAAAVEVDTNELARCAAITAVDTRVACYDALAKLVLPRPGELTSAAPTPLNPNDPAHFGLTPRQLKTTPQGPQSIKAVVSQITQDRLNNVSLVLDNGQTWTFIEPDPRVRPGDAVTIRRAALGSFLMITPSRRSYRVERSN